jgi:hypothetical protein
MSETQMESTPAPIPPQRRLEFGYNAGLPPDCTCAWGARAILEENHNWDKYHYTKNGTPRKRIPPEGRMYRISLCYDRESVFGDEASIARLVAVLNKNFPAIILAAQIALEDGPLDYGIPGEADIWSGEGVRVVANSNGSHGYLYMCAFFTLGMSVELLSEPTE